MLRRTKICYIVFFGLACFCFRQDISLSGVYCVSPKDISSDYIIFSKNHFERKFKERCVRKGVFEIKGKDLIIHYTRFVLPKDSLNKFTSVFEMKDTSLNPPQVIIKVK